MRKTTKASTVIAALAFSLASATALAGSSATDAVGQAEADLKAATSAGAVWRLIDPATGGKAVGLGKLLKTAKAKLEANDEAEATRLAHRISWAAQTGIVQAEQQKGAKPTY
ncbi:MAG: hypothetical protein AAEI92_05270 [Arenicellales bacterium]|jgi:hypothetical protein